jgi:hypothetical protein
MDVDADLKGLKLSTAVKILLATAGRVRIRIARQFSVASTSIGSLLMSVATIAVSSRVTYTVGSWKTLSNRSSKPAPSASRLARGSRGCCRGTIAREVSFWSGLCRRVSLLEICSDGTYSWVRDNSWRLDLHDFLQEFDAAYLDGDGRAVHTSQYIELDCHHRLPYRRLIWMQRTKRVHVSDSLLQRTALWQRKEFMDRLFKRTFS